MFKLSNGLNVLVFPLGDVDHRTSVKGEFEACIILNHLFLEKETGTCTHLMEKGHLLCGLHLFQMRSM